LKSEVPSYLPTGTGLIAGSELPEVLLTEARRRRALLVAMFAAIALAGLGMGLVWPKKYTAATTILVQESNIIKPLMEGRAVTTANADRASIAREVIFSRRVMEQILKAGGWLKGKPSPLQQERTIEDIKNRTILSNVRDNLIRIQYTDTDPERAFLVTRELAHQFITESLAAKERESRDAYEFINSQVADYRKKLSDAEGKLKAYRGGNPDATPGSETDTNTRISQLRTQIENARVDLIEQRSKERALVGQVSGESATLAVETREGEYRSRLAQLQGQLDQLLLKDTDQHPDVIRVRHQIEDLQEQVAAEKTRRERREASGVRAPVDENILFNPLHQELRSRLAEARREIAASQSRMGMSETLLKSELERSRRIADSANTLSELTRDYEVNRDIYQDLLKRRENARVSMNLDADHRGLTFNIQEPASLPLRPLGVRFLHFGIAGIGLGVALPLALLFGLVRVDTRLRSPNQVEQFTGLPMLASVPEYANAHDRRRRRVQDILLILLIVAVVAAYAIALALKWTLVS
jgi:polysaccharide chain length determinant protein (PEP-CTERM system associated)